jgi:hypothetical protein
MYITFYHHYANKGDGMGDYDEDDATMWSIPAMSANGAMPHTPPMLRPLEDLPLSHADYLAALLRSMDVQYPDELDPYAALYTPGALQRLKKIKDIETSLYHRIFETWVRGRKDLYFPSVDQRIDEDGVQMLHGALHSPAPLCPALPHELIFPMSFFEHAAPWLDAYCAYSERWAPRAAQSFHKAVGLWVLSTVAARRLCVEFGQPLYPVLFLSLIAESSQYTKTTAAANGQTLLRAAGCHHFLTPDRSTPQALLRHMSGRVPGDYGHKNADEQEAIQQRLRFAGQRGWYYEEWGGMLHQMNRQESPMAGFHELLRVLDDGKPDFSSETIQRGLEYVEAPYLSLLASATPQDLAPFMQSGSKWWRDGFWPRFAFLIPEQQPRLDRRPQGRATPPSALIAELHTWHTSLGLPKVQITNVLDGKQRPTDQWTLEREALPCKTLHVPSDTLEAYYQYNEVLLSMTIAPDLRPSYSRLHDKAMRVAMLLASLQGKDQITLPHWAYAQEVVEHWRAMLHRLTTMMSESMGVSTDAQHEDRIENLLGHQGPLPMRAVQRKLHLDSATIKRLAQNMAYVGRVTIGKAGRTVYISLSQETDMQDDDIQKSEQNEVPF